MSKKLGKYFSRIQCRIFAQIYFLIIVTGISILWLDEILASDIAHAAGSGSEGKLEAIGGKDYGQLEMAVYTRSQRYNWIPYIRLGSSILATDYNADNNRSTIAYAASFGVGVQLNNNISPFIGGSVSIGDAEVCELYTPRFTYCESALFTAANSDIGVNFYISDAVVATIYTRFYTLNSASDNLSDSRRGIAYGVGFKTNSF